MSFALRGPSKRKGDLADSFPLVGRCLKCFKNMIVDPFTLCPIAPGKKNCERCNKGSESCGLIPRSLSEACRSWEDTVMVFKKFLEDHPEYHHYDDENPVDWVFEDWMEAHKLRNSSSRLEKPDEDATWAGVPQEFKNVYIEGVTLITAISTEINKMSTSGASNAENAMLIAVRELTAEVRACREVFMAVHGVIPTENERIPESVARHFTKS